MNNRKPDSISRATAIDTAARIMARLRRSMAAAVLCAAVLLPLASCSPVKRLADDETLYTGIKEISYGYKAKSAQAATPPDTAATGVITDVAKAIKGIGRILDGESLNTDVQEAIGAMQEASRDRSLTRRQRDSIKAEARLLDQALATARTEVDAVLAYAPTGSLFGSSSLHLPSSPGVMFYNLSAGKTSRFGKWLYNSFAKEPVTLTAVNPRTRTLVARNTLRSFGFFDGDVEYDILYDKKPKRAHLAYSVFPRRLYRLDSIEYRGFPMVMDSLLRRSMPLSVLHRGDAFTVASLDAERTRLATLMRNRGYYNFSADAIAYRADTVQRSGWVQLRVQPSGSIDDTALRRYYIGRTNITLLENGNYQVVDSLPHRRDSLRRQPSKRMQRLVKWMKQSKRPMLHIKMKYSGEPGRPPLRLSAMRKKLFYREGMPYNHALMTRVQEQLSAMGIFSQMQVSMAPQDTTATCDTLGVNIIAVLDKPYDSEFEARFTSKSNGQIGPGASYSLSKRNAFRRAETVTFKVRGSYEWQTGAHPTGVSVSAINSYELGASLLLDYPRLVLPGTRRFNMNALTSNTTFKVDGSWLNRAGYFAMVEVSGEATYTMQRHRLSKHTFTPVKLKYTSLLSTTERFQQVADRNKALYISMRDQLVPSMEYTYSLTSSRRSRHPGAFTVTVKEAGNVTSGIYAACGRRFDERDKVLLGVPFAQYVRVNVDMRKERKFTQRQSLVGHLALGAIYCYGNSVTAPYSDLFCVGGANSIRAFCLRGVGPGRYNPASSSYTYLDQMGDLKLEANLEYRFPVVQSLYGAVFADCGNVWLMKDDKDRPGGQFSLAHLGRDLALGTGVGLRYDLDFLVIRFDLGIGLHAPYDTGKRGYYNLPRFGRSLGYHFAIGYPF